MAKSKKKKAAEEAASEDNRIESYWKAQLETLGRELYFIDTGAILPALDPDDTQIRPFIEDEFIKDQLITSTYVVHESVRRLLKSSRPFTGPPGLYGRELVLHFIKEWLATFGVRVICIPELIFEDVKRKYEEVRYIECDMTDVSSLVIIEGMAQNRIISPDTHFRRLGLDLLP